MNSTMNSTSTTIRGPLEGTGINPAEVHAGVERIERAFQNLAERVEAGNERLQRAILQQRLNLNGFELAEVTSRAQHAVWELGRDAQPQDANGGGDAAPTPEEQARWADIKAWADAYDEKPVDQITDPLEMHKKMWLDGVTTSPRSDR